MPPPLSACSNLSIIHVATKCGETISNLMMNTIRFSAVQKLGKFKAYSFYKTDSLLCGCSHTYLLLDSVQIIEYHIVECYCTCIIEILSYFFYPAKFDKFKDEKFSDFRTVSVSQRKTCQTRKWWNNAITVNSQFKEVFENSK